MEDDLVVDCDPQVGVSLESVVQKATDLAHVLRTCKHNLASNRERSNFTSGGRSTEVNHFVSEKSNDKWGGYKMLSIKFCWKSEEHFIALIN